jgi:predicted transcriptional regulator
MPNIRDPNAKRHKPPTAFRLDDELMQRVRVFCKAHHLMPSHTAVVEAALREFLEKHEPSLPASKRDVPSVVASP